MNIIFTDHAEENLAERGINKEFVRDTISKPDEISEGKKRRKRLIK